MAIVTHGHSSLSQAGLLWTISGCASLYKSKETFRITALHVQSMEPLAGCANRT